MTGRKKEESEEKREPRLLWLLLKVDLGSSCWVRQSANVLFHQTLLPDVTRNFFLLNSRKKIMPRIKNIVFGIKFLLYSYLRRQEEHQESGEGGAGRRETRRRRKEQDKKKKNKDKNKILAQEEQRKKNVEKDKKLQLHLCTFSQCLSQRLCLTRKKKQREEEGMHQTCK